MMPTDPLTITVLDLDAALGGGANLMIGGGFGLYMKQLQLEKSGLKTLLPKSKWPQARTTQDIDLFLRAEIVADAAHMDRLRQVLDQLGFIVEEDAKWMKFARDVGGRKVIIDLMVGPLGEFESQTERHSIRVKPIGTSGLHARAANDAIGVEYEPIGLSISDGNRSSEVLVPQAFPFALMKLGALRDRINDANKDEGRHHALDLYRIIAMLTEAEDGVAQILAMRYSKDPVIAAAMRTVDELFAAPPGLGRIRLREHPLCPADADPIWLANELKRLIAG
jgi:hypothetical protein